MAMGDGGCTTATVLGALTAEGLQQTHAMITYFEPTSGQFLLSLLLTKHIGGRVHCMHECTHTIHILCERSHSF